MNAIICGLVGMIAAVAIALIVPAAKPTEPVLPVIKVGNSILQEGYLACTTPNLLFKGILDNVQCMGTSDLAKYPVLKVTLHDDNTAEVVFDLQDDTTAILWMATEAVGVSK